MASSSVSSSSPTTTFLRQPADLSSSAVAAATAERFSPSPSSLIQLSKSAETPESRIRQQYNEARQHLKDKRYVEARDLFSKLSVTFGRDESTLINCADCLLGIAYSYPEGSVDRSDSVVEAKDLLDAALEKTLKGDASDEATIRAFQKIRVLYLECTNAQDPFHEDVIAKIEVCSRKIPEISNFYEKLEQAEDLIREGQLDQARAFLERLPLVPGDKAQVILARAQFYILYASTFPTDDPSRNSHVLKAQDLTFEAYDRKKELFASDKSKAAALSLFIKLYNGLRELIPIDDVDYLQVIAKLADCERELASLRPAEEPDSGKTPPDRKVTPDPVNDYWKPARLFIAFSFAAAVIVGTAVLGRRLITRLN
jgi:hypothetical protein